MLMRPLEASELMLQELRSFSSSAYLCAYVLHGHEFCNEIVMRPNGRGDFYPKFSNNLLLVTGSSWQASATFFRELMFSTMGIS